MDEPTDSGLNSASLRETSTASAPASSATEPAARKRSRTGCLTCKKRRIRCDEKHPACVRCTSTGRLCDGYAAMQTIKRNQPQPLVLMIVTDFERATHDPTTSLHLQYFFHVSAPALTNHKTSAFWNATVLQACQQVPCIRDLAIAVASIERSLRSQSDSSLFDEDPAVYLMRYGNALKQLSTDQNFGVIMIGCLMLVLLEDLRRNPYAALTHIRAGRQLLATNASTRLDGHLYDELRTVFKALFEHQPELAANDVRINHVYRTGVGPRALCCSRTFIADRSNVSFQSLDHASKTLQSMRHLCINAQPFPQPLSRFHVIPGLTERLNDWLERFNRFVSILNDEQQTAHKIEIHTLRAYHLILRISSCCTTINTEMCYDYYAQDLEGLVKKFSIMTSMGGNNMTVLIFFVACKYRDVAGRRMAIRLLRDEFNGWKGALLAQVAEIIVRLEEEGIEDAVTPEDIPEERRVRPCGIRSFPNSNGRETLCLVRAPFGIDAPGVEVAMPLTRFETPSCVDVGSKNAVLAAAMDLDHFSQVEYEDEWNLATGAVSRIWGTD